MFFKALLVLFPLPGPLAISSSATFASVSQQCFFFNGNWRQRPISKG